MRTKLSKPMLGDSSINRTLINTERMINEDVDFSKPTKPFWNDLLKLRDGAPIMVSKSAGHLSATLKPKLHKACDLNGRMHMTMA